MSTYSSVEEIIDQGHARTFARVNRVCNENGYTLKKYDFKKKKILIVCKNDHWVETSPSKTFLERQCCQCYLMDLKNKQIEKINRMVTQKNGTWVSGEYSGLASIINIQCSKGHEWETRAGNIIDGKWCPECAKEYNSKCVRAAAYFRNINKEIEYYHSGQHIFDKLNREINERQKEIRDSKSYIIAKRKQYKDKEAARKKYKERYENDTEFRLTECLKSSIVKMIKKDMPIKKYYDILGFDANALKEHLESGFKPGMSWDNYGKNGWHVDHIIPKSWFNLTKPDGSLDKKEFKKCWSLKNLQPLWAEENSKKGNRYAG